MSARMSDAMLKKVAATVKEAGNVSAAAAVLNLSRNTLAGQVREAVRRGFMERTSERAPLAQMGANRLQHEVKAHRQLSAKMRKELGREEHMRDAIFGLSREPIGRPDWAAKKPVSGECVSVPILMASDFQLGEKIASNEMDGVNAFNEKIALQRYRMMIDKAVEVAHTHMGKGHKYPGIVYARIGDMVSGEIHQELRETNDLQSIPAVKRLVEMESAGIETLLSKFGKVHVPTTPGNHGRNTLKPFAKKFAENNYDVLSAWMLEREFKNEKRITWQTPMSGDAIVPILGWNWLFTHGDRIGSRGGEGFVGPAVTIARGMKRTFDYYARLGQRIDQMAIGHFHTPMQLPWGFCNGSLPGLSEYAKSGRMHPSEPSQWLVFTSGHRPVSASWELHLAPRLKMGRGSVF